MSIDHLKEKAHRDKKVLVVVTDGIDNASMISLENLVNVSQQSGVLIYAVGLLSEEDRRDAKRPSANLHALAEATGGETFFPKELTEVDHIATKWRAISAASTPLHTRPPMRLWTAHSAQIKITVNAPGHPTVRTRSGYYATPDQARGRRARSNGSMPCSALAHEPRLPPAPLAQPLPALAHRDLFRSARRIHRLPEFWRFTWRTRRELHTLFAVGGRNGPWPPGSSIR